MISVGIFALCLGATALVCVFVGWVLAKRIEALPAPLEKLLARAGLGAEGPVTEEDLYELVDDADQQDLIDDNQREMITNIFELADVTAGDIMTHRTDMVAVEESTPCQNLLNLALESGNSRMPLYRKTVDEVVGMLYVKDLLRLFGQPKALQGPVSQFCRPAMFVPESRPAGQLLLDFKRQRTQIAIVVDEYGGTAGLVSMEDILEEIVGDIQDEYDNEEALLTPTENGFWADGSLDLEDVFEAFGLECPLRSEDEEFDSVGGLIAHQLGRIPSQSEQAVVEWGGLRFLALQVDERRIRRVHCSLLTQPG